MPSKPSGLRRNRDFNLLWGSQTLSDLGSNMSQLAFPLLTLTVTGSPVLAGLVGTIALLIQTVTRMPAGVLLDRVNRRTTMLTCDGLRLVAFAALGALIVTGRESLALIIVAAVIDAACGAVFDIAEYSALPLVVAADDMPDAVARNSVRGSLTGLLGPPLGGLLYGIGRALPFFGDAASYVLSFLGVTLIRTPMQKTGQVKSAVSSSFAEGLRFVFGVPFLRALMIIASSFNLALGGIMFTLILALRLHGVTPAAIGVAYAILGVGGLLGGMAAGYIRRRTPLQLLIQGICWTGVAFLAADALLAGRALSAVPAACVVFLLPAVNSVLLAHQAAITPNEMQGRVFSVLRTFSRGLAALGPLLAGTLVHAVGGAGAMLFFAAVMAVAALAATLGKGIRDMRPAGAFSRAEQAVTPAQDEAPEDQIQSHAGQRPNL